MTANKRLVIGTASMVLLPAAAHRVPRATIRAEPGNAGTVYVKVGDGADATVADSEPFNADDSYEFRNVDLSKVTAIASAAGQILWLHIEEA